MKEPSHDSGFPSAARRQVMRSLRQQVCAVLIASCTGLACAHVEAEDRVAQARKHAAVTSSSRVLLEGYRPQRRRPAAVATISIGQVAEANTEPPPVKLTSSPLVGAVDMRSRGLALSENDFASRSIATEQTVTVDNVAVGQTIQLSGFEVACAAASNWAPAHALRARGATVVRAFCDEDESSRKTAAAINRFMHMQAAHQEDIGAGTALRAYYTRIVLAQQLALITQALAMSDEEQERLRALLDQGVASGADRTQFARKRIELLDRAAQVDSQDRQLERVLEHLTDFPFTASNPGMEILEVRGQPLDCDGLVDFAFCNRHDLQSWVYLRSQVNQETAPVIAKMLSTVTGGFALPLPDASRIKDLLCRDRYAQLAADLRRELSCVIQAQRDWIEKTVLEKCSELELAYQRIQFAEEVLASWDERLAQVERLSALGQAVPESVVAAKTERIGAQVELASRRLEAKLAEVELSEACGGISQRCCAGQPWLITGAR